MQSPKGDPTYIKNKEKYFMDIAKAVGVASTHPKAHLAVVSSFETEKSSAMGGVFIHTPKLKSIALHMQSLVPQRMAHH